MQIDASKVQWDGPDPAAVRWDEPEKRERNSAIDTGNAVGTGYFRGLTRLVGLPVDTVANVLDLGKAAVGSGYQAVTGKPAPDALQVGDRSKVVGSGDYLLKKLGQTAPGNFMLNPENPEYEGGYAQTLGTALSSVMKPKTTGQAANQGALATTGAAGSKAVYDATGDPALAVTASLLPGAVQQVSGESARYAVRGGEQGRRNMAQRVQDLKNAGVERPTLGLASGNGVIGGVENLLQSTPGAVGTMRAARDDVVNALRSKAEESANLASSNRGALESGVAIQRGIREFKDQYKDRQGKLYDKVEETVGSQFPTNVDATRKTLSTINLDIPGAPELSKFFKNGKIEALASALRSDTSGAPQSVHVYRQPPLAGGGIMNAPVPQDPLQVVIPQGPPRTTLPFEAVKKTRTLVGNEIADNTIASDVPRSKWNPLYGALSTDMQAAAQAAGPEGAQAFNRANDYTRAGAKRLERVAPFAQTVAPEQAYTAMVNASRENVSTLQAVKKTLPSDARGSVAGTVIERLGKATNGTQNDTGTAWSPETFLTNWNKMTPKARDELFSGFQNAPQVKENVEAIARATSMMRESSKLWANPSGSGANIAARSTLGALGAGGVASAAGAVSPAIPLAAAGAMGTSRLLAQALKSPKTIEMAMQDGKLSPQEISLLARALGSTGQLGSAKQRE